MCIAYAIRFIDIIDSLLKSRSNVMQENMIKTAWISRGHPRRHEPVMQQAAKLACQSLIGKCSSVIVRKSLPATVCVQPTLA